MLGFLFPESAPRTEYGPEWDPTFGTPQQNGGDNVWAPGFGEEQPPAGPGPEWNPGGYDDVWF